MRGTGVYSREKSRASQGRAGRMNGNVTDSSQASSHRSTTGTHTTHTHTTVTTEHQLDVSDKTKATKRIMSASRLKINDLRNQVGSLQREMKELQAENRLLKRIEQRQMRALDRFENAEDEIPQMLLQHHNEERALKELYRKSVERNQRNEATLREKEREMERMRRRLKKLEETGRERELPEKDELARRVERLELQLEEKRSKISEMERSLELQTKRHRHELQVEMGKTKQLSSKLKDIEGTRESLERKVAEKDKELGVRAMYQNRVVKPPHKLQTSTPSPQGSGKKKRRERENSTTRSEPVSKSSEMGSPKKDEDLFPTRPKLIGRSQKRGETNVGLGVPKTGERRARSEDRTATGGGRNMIPEGRSVTDEGINRFPTTAAKKATVTNTSHRLNENFSATQQKRTRAPSLENSARQSLAYATHRHQLKQQHDLSQKHQNPTQHKTDARNNLANAASPKGRLKVKKAAVAVNKVHSPKVRSRFRNDRIVTPAY